MMRMPNPEVKVGQIWASTDHRDMVWVVPEGAKFYEGRYEPRTFRIQAILGNDKALCCNTRTGRLTEISLTRLHYKQAERGYLLMNEVPGTYGTDCSGYADV
jgi:hypothetical protein